MSPNDIDAKVNANVYTQEHSKAFVVVDTATDIISEEVDIDSPVDVNVTVSHLSDLSSGEYTNRNTKSVGYERKARLEKEKKLVFLTSDFEMLLKRDSIGERID